MRDPVTVIADVFAGVQFAGSGAPFVTSHAFWPDLTSCSVVKLCGGDWSDLVWPTCAAAGLAMTAASETVDKINGLNRRIDPSSPEILEISQRVVGEREQKENR
jgi:hypothetical protein